MFISRKLFFSAWFSLKGIYQVNVKEEQLGKIINCFKSALKIYPQVKDNPACEAEIATLQEGFFEIVKEIIKLADDPLLKKDPHKKKSFIKRSTNNGKINGFFFNAYEKEKREKLAAAILRGMNVVYREMNEKITSLGEELERTEQLEDYNNKFKETLSSLGCDVEIKDIAENCNQTRKKIYFKCLSKQNTMLQMKNN